MAQTNRTDTEAEIKALSDQLSVLRNDIAGITELLGDMGERRKSAAVHSLRDASQDIQQRGEELAQGAKRQAGELEERLLDNIRAQPAMSLGVAAGVGFLVGYLNGRK